VKYFFSTHCHLSEIFASQKLKKLYFRGSNSAIMDVKPFAVFVISLLLIHGASAQKIGFVEPMKSTVVYAGIPTPITVRTDANPENVTLSVSAGRVEKGEDNVYYLQMSDKEVGKTVTVTVFNNKSKKEIGTSKFRVCKVPDPIPFVGRNVRDGAHWPSDIIFPPKLSTTTWEDFIYQISWEVISYRINIIRDGKMVVDSICLGDTIPECIQQIIESSPTNTSVTFKNIVAHSSVGARMLSDFTVFINDEFVIEDPLWDDGAPKPDLDDDPAFLFTEVEPQFPSGLDAMNEYLVKEVKFPEQARNLGVKGTVFVEFVVERDGSLSEIKTKMPLHPLCDEEVLRVVRNMPKWQPGMNMGKPVRCRYMIPVTFNVNEE